jgi:stress response protein YsnF
LREERVHVERHPVDRPVEAGDDAFREGTLEIKERGEEAVVSKTARVVEEVVVGKQVEEHTETINDTVRRTDVDVQEVNTKTTTDRNRDR